MRDICSWDTNYTFLQLLPSNIFITMWLPKWGQFVGRGHLQIWIQLQIIFGLQLFDLNLGYTASLAPVPSMSHLNSCGEVKSGSISRSIFGLQLFYLNLGSTPSLSPVPSMPHLRSCGEGVSSDSWSSSRSIFVLYLWGSTPSLAPVPSVSQLRSCGGQLCIWIQLQIHIWVVTFQP